MSHNPLDLDLPKRLAAADGQAVKQELLDELRLAHDSLVAVVRTGCERAEFADASVLLEAVSAGKEILDGFVVPATPITSS